MQNKSLRAIAAIVFRSSPFNFLFIYYFVRWFGGGVWGVFCCDLGAANFCSIINWFWVTSISTSTSTSTHTESTPKSCCKAKMQQRSHNSCCCLIILEPSSEPSPSRESGSKEEDAFCQVYFYQHCGLPQHFAAVAWWLHWQKQFNNIKEFKLYLLVVHLSPYFKAYLLKT